MNPPSGMRMAESSLPLCGMLEWLRKRNVSPCIQIKDFQLSALRDHPGQRKLVGFRTDPPDGSLPTPSEEAGDAPDAPSEAPMILPQHAPALNIVVAAAPFPSESQGHPQGPGGIRRSEAEWTRRDGQGSTALSPRSIHREGTLPMNHPPQYQPCLLYTSPSPRDRTRSRMPSSA